MGGSDGEARERVRLVIKTIRERILYISQRELARRLGVNEASVTRWESTASDQVPRVQQYHQILEMGGIDLSLQALLHPSDAVQARLRNLEQRLAQMEPTVREAGRAARDAVARLEPIAGDPGDYMTVAEAAVLKGFSRAAVHNWIVEGRLRAWRREGKRVVLREDVEKLQTRR